MRRGEEFVTEFENRGVRIFDSNVHPFVCCCFKNREPPFCTNSDVLYSEYKKTAASASYADQAVERTCHRIHHDTSFACLNPGLQRSRSCARSLNSSCVPRAVGCSGPPPLSGVSRIIRAKTERCVLSRVILKPRLRVLNQTSG